MTRCHGGAPGDALDDHLAGSVTAVRIVTLEPEGTRSRTSPSGSGTRKEAARMMWSECCSLRMPTVIPDTIDLNVLLVPGEGLLDFSPK